MEEEEEVKSVCEEEEEDDDGRHPDEKNSVLLAIRAPPLTEIKAGGMAAENGLNQDEYQELMGYLDKKYSLYMNTEPPGSSNANHQNNNSQRNYFDNKIQIYQIKNINVNVNVNYVDQHKAADTNSSHNKSEAPVYTGSNH